MDATPATRVIVEPGPDARAVLRLAGPLDVSSTAAARHEVEAKLATAGVSTLEVDGSGIERGDMSGMSLLYELAEGRVVPGVRATIRGLRPEFQTLFPPPRLSRASKRRRPDAASSSRSGWRPLPFSPT